jgi:hypothetical protein
MGKKITRSLIEIVVIVLAAFIFAALFFGTCVLVVG